MGETKPRRERGASTEADALAEMARRISASLDLDEVLRIAVESAHQLVGPDVTSISLADPHGGLTSVANIGNRLPALNTRLGETAAGVGGHVLATGRAHQTRWDEHDPSIVPLRSCWNRWPLKASSARWPCPCARAPMRSCFLRPFAHKA